MNSLNLSFGAGVQHIQGDMFVGVPKGEAILLKVKWDPRHVWLLCYMSHFQNSHILHANTWDTFFAE